MASHATLSTPSGREVAPPAQVPRSRRRAEPLGAWLAVAPAALLLLAFVGYPLVQAVRLSVSTWGGVGNPVFTGLDNFRTALTDDDVWHSLRVTVVFAVGSTVGIVVLATILAAAVSNGVPGARFYKVVWFLPGIAPVSAVGIFWALSMQPDQGAANTVLGALGLGSSHEWLSDSGLAIYPTIAVSVWAGVGFAFLLILGAAEQVPTSVYEAATIDGAGRTRQLLSITVPLIRPVLVITSLLELTWAANGFTLVYALTGGGPGDATTTLPVLIYKQAFQFTDYGLASAMAVLSGTVLLLVGVVGLRLSASAQNGGV